MKYFTKKAIIEIIDEERRVSMINLQEEADKFVKESLQKAMFNSPEVALKIQEFHDGIEALDKSARSIADLITNSKSEGVCYDVVASKLSYYFNPQDLFKTSSRLIKAYITQSFYSSDSEILRFVDLKAHSQYSEMCKVKDEVGGQYRLLLNNLKALPTAKQCVNYLESIGYDRSQFTYEEEKCCTDLTLPLNTDFLIGMKKQETPEEGI